VVFAVSSRRMVAAALVTAAASATLKRI